METIKDLNLATAVARILRSKGNKSVKSLYWNSDRADLSVFPVGSESFNYAPDPDATVEEIADYIAEECEKRNAGKKTQ